MHTIVVTRAEGDGVGQTTAYADMSVALCYGVEFTHSWSGHSLQVPPHVRMRDTSVP